MDTGQPSGVVRWSWSSKRVQVCIISFLAYAAGTLTLQAQILRNTLAADEDTCTSLNHWLSLYGLSAGDSLPIGNQRVLDSAVVAHTYKSVLNSQTSQFNRARLLAAAAAHSGDWLQAVPISACGLHLSDESLRVADGLRLCSEICQSFH